MSTPRHDRSPEGQGINAYGVPVAVMERLLEQEYWKPYTCSACGRSGQFIGTFFCCGAPVSPSPDHFAGAGK